MRYDRCYAMKWTILSWLSAWTRCESRAAVLHCAMVDLLEESSWMGAFGRDMVARSLSHWRKIRPGYGQTFGVASERHRGARPPQAVQKCMFRHPFHSHIFTRHPRSPGRASSASKSAPAPLRELPHAQARTRPASSSPAMYRVRETNAAPQRAEAEDRSGPLESRRREPPLRAEEA